MQNKISFSFSCNTALIAETKQVVENSRENKGLYNKAPLEASEQGH